MAAERDFRSQRALRLASGAALALALSFGLALPIPFIAPLLSVVLLSVLTKPLPFKAGLGLTLLLMLITSSGLLLIPLLRYYAAAGVLLIGLCLFLAFRYGLRGGNPLLATFMVIGLTMISAAGASDFGLAVLVIEALVKGLLLAVLVLNLSHGLFPEPANAPAPPKAPSLPASETSWVALRAALVVMPAFLLALINPGSYMPLIMQAVNLGQQSCTTKARDAGRVMLGSTLCGGLLAILLWSALSLWVNLWMFYLWTLLFGLLVARQLFAVSPSQFGPAFWQNSLTTMIILLGQSVQDSDNGKDVYTAFAIRMSLFIAVTLYACLMVHLLDRQRQRRNPPSTNHECSDAS
ncbi:MAG: hypothetical protein A2Y50_12510 [Pseudomonadales bacterium RIFCSPLOWO2_12_59_9]|nr:MAG: hypothetical protein A2Y50_12510 [Pseudomonadales bacterium RIFCSPLOWO2_12_59_9]